MIQNPILPGFHPDPSLVRVNDDYYLATSTFEWFPGIRLHHSRDLVHWRPIGHALTRPSQLDLGACDDSTGVWAPCLTWDPEGQLFYLAYTLMRHWSSGYFDLDNFAVTAPAIEGPWSDPVYLNSSGFDPSFFHEGGRHWVVNLEWETRPGKEHPGAIVLQEFDPQKKELTGEPVRISRGTTDLGCQEGPHLFRRGEWYYLMTAEGGTGFGHAVALARSQSLTGPWESSPNGPILTAALDPNLNRRGVDDFLKPYQFNPHSPLQKTGHGSLVETNTGEWYLAHLCARPLGEEHRSTLGRETALQKCFWTADGWLVVDKGPRPSLEIESPRVKDHPWPNEPVKDDFDRDHLGTQYQTLRIPADGKLSLTDRPGFLRLYGQNSLGARTGQSLVVRRVQHHRVRLETRLEADVRSYRQGAGLVWFYDSQMFYALCLTWDEDFAQPCLRVISVDNGARSESDALPVEGWHQLFLRADCRIFQLQFWASADEKNWVQVGPVLDASHCSDEYSRSGHFTGTMAGLFCYDQLQRRLSADFDYLTYEEIHDQ